MKRAVVTKEHPLTLAEYFHTPETVLPQALIYGKLRVADPPLPRHQAAVGDLFLALAAHVREHGLGDIWLSPIDVILDADRALVVQPDLVYISNERRDMVTDRIRGAPDLVIEVLSPHPRIGRLDERIGWFARYGVRECWLLYQLTRRLEVLRFADGALVDRVSLNEATAIRSCVIPDFRKSIGSILRWRSW